MFQFEEEEERKKKIIIIYKGWGGKKKRWEEQTSNNMLLNRKEKNEEWGKMRMKNKLRKYLSVERRDLWDGPKIYDFCNLSVDKLKHKLKHIPKKDNKMKSKLEEALRWKTRSDKKISYSMTEASL